jgi:hypothetical protein
MAVARRCSRCEQLWSAYASATYEHLQALQEQERSDAGDPARRCALARKIEASGAERAAARVKITTHIAMSHSREWLVGLTAGAAR